MKTLIIGLFCLFALWNIVYFIMLIIPSVFWVCEACIVLAAFGIVGGVVATLAVVKQPTKEK